MSHSRDFVLFACAVAQGESIRTSKRVLQTCRMEPIFLLHGRALAWSGPRTTTMFGESINLCQSNKCVHYVQIDEPVRSRAQGFGTRHRQQHCLCFEGGLRPRTHRWFARLVGQRAAMTCWLPRLKECDLEKAPRMYKAKTGVGCDGFHPNVPLDLTKETRGEVVEFLEKVEQSGEWSQQACTTMFFLILKNVTSERPIALMPTLIRWWEALRAPEVAKW